MTCVVDPVPARHLEIRKEGFWHKLSRAFRRARRQRVSRLEPQELSDHLKRDLGFLDGRG